MANIDPTPFGDKYLLVEHLATGGMAEIYRAQYAGIEGFAKELVIKRLRGEFARRPEVVRMFLDEARIAATLSHNNIVHTYDLGEIDGEFYIAMEHLRGEELVQVLRRSVKSGHKLPQSLAIGMLMQSLEGLHYAHTRTREDGSALGLVHRDINPTNIHVGYDGVCKIVDFGIAATMATLFRSTGQFAGKLSYMAPEQMLGQSVDHRADIFPMGVLLYEMVLGRRLFRGRPDDVRRRILEGEVPAPTFVDPRFPPSLEAIIMKAVEVDREQRYQNCDHMFRDLEAYVQESGLSWSPRKISAYMAEMFGEGARADLDYEDQYDDISDDALDFDEFEALERRVGGEADEAPPEWAQPVSSDVPRARKRTLTIGNLEAFIADINDPDPEAKSGSGDHPDLEGRPRSGDAVQGRRKDPSRTSGHHRIVGPGRAAAGSEPRTGPGPSAPGSRSAGSEPVGGGAPRHPTAPHRSRKSGRHPTLSGNVPDVALSSGGFGHTVMTEQSRSVSPLFWIAIAVVLSGIGYYAVSILSAK